MPCSGCSSFHEVNPNLKNAWPLEHLWYLFKVTVCGFWQYRLKTWTLPFLSMLRFLRNSSALVLFETVILFTALWVIANTSLTRVDNWPTFWWNKIGCNNAINVFFFFNWDSLHTRLNNNYKAWSYKKKKHKKIKAYRKSV